MINYIILLFIIYFIFLQNKETKETFKDIKNSNFCNTEIKIKKNDSIQKHIDKLNNCSSNPNTLSPKFPLSYNLKYNNEYHILNNYGIKYNKKRNNYLSQNNDCLTIPYNTHKLYKKYDTSITNSFLTIPNPLKIKNNNKNKNDDNNIPNINLIYNENVINWSYNTEYLKDNYFRLFYEIDYDKHLQNTEIELSNFNKITIYDKNIKCNDFTLTINNYKNIRNIYRLKFNHPKTRCFVVLYNKNKAIQKSNNIIN